MFGVLVNICCNHKSESRSYVAMDGSLVVKSFGNCLRTPISLMTSNGRYGCQGLDG